MTYQGILTVSKIPASAHISPWKRDLHFPEQAEFVSLISQ